MTEAPFVIKHRECRCDKIDREPLFTWENAEDERPSDDQEQVVTFTVPQYFEAHVGLDYLDILHSQGSDAATRWACLTALGVDGWNALRSPAIDNETFTSILTVILDRVRGALRSGPKGR